MSFFYRILIYQSVIVFSAYLLFFSKVNEHALSFKDELLTLSSSHQSLDFISNLLQNNNFELIFTGLLYAELSFAVLAILGLRFFGFLEAVIVFLHGIVMFNPFSEKVQYSNLYGIKYEFVLLVGLVLSMLVSATSGICCAVVKKNLAEKVDKAKTTSNSSDKSRSKSPGAQRKKLD